ncbi:AfsR/SARP family transcriptional regulator [Nonomuraea monospora]|uniref:AfsR/SARP family transcriptional regulator n=1 Tax=Nonomuraea monospora TaxID=568818 RepID=A0ABN3CIR0_9ACTN
MIKFNVLGPLEVATEADASLPKGRKARQVLALLLLRANEVVDVETIAEELWEGRGGGVGAIRTHVYNLRTALAAQPATRAVADMLVTEPTGYLLRVEPGQLDAEVFADSVAEGRQLMSSGAAEKAARRLRDGLSLWRGRALANVAPGPVVARHLTYLEEIRNRAVELRLEADLRLGHHRELVAELRTLIARNPLNEWYHLRLIECLCRSGRRGEALLAYHDLRRILDEELGLEPSAEARRLQHGILSDVEHAPADQQSNRSVYNWSLRAPLARRPAAVASTNRGLPQMK